MNNRHKNEECWDVKLSNQTPNNGCDANLQQNRTGEKVLKNTRKFWIHLLKEELKLYHGSWNEKSTPPFFWCDYIYFPKLNRRSPNFVFQLAAAYTYEVCPCVWTWDLFWCIDRFSQRLTGGFGSCYFQAAHKRICTVACIQSVHACTRGPPVYPITPS